jgi:C-terminal processing protease CtpA/Prc
LQRRLEVRLAEGDVARHALTFAGARDWRLATATYGNQLGVEIAELDGALREQLAIDEETGVLVTGVSPESEAAKALLVRHDIILKIDDRTIPGTKQFNDLIGSLQGKTAKFHILRKGKPVIVSVTLPKSAVYELAYSAFLNAAVAPDTARVALIAIDGASAEHHYRIGVALAEADDVLRSQLRLAAGEGLVVTDVMAESPAAKAGIQRHDVLTKLDDKRLTAVEVVNAQIQEIKDRPVSIALYRAGNEVLLTVTPRLTEEPTSKAFVTHAIEQLLLDHEEKNAVRGRLVFRDWVANSAAPGHSSHIAVAVQIAELKKQLADLQKAVEGLEATLQSESLDKPQSPAEKK